MSRSEDASGDNDTDHPPDASPYSAPHDLIDPTNTIIEHSLSDSMRATLKNLRDLETSPSCNKVATAALIHSCSTLDGSVTPNDNEIRRGIDMIVQEEINVYAARLAVCELQSAQASVPQACSAFVPTVKTVRKTAWAGYFTSNGPSKPRLVYPDYDEITEQGLQRCLNALHSNGLAQGWTSFSNCRTNAILMCNSMRGEIERDHDIHLHKVLATTTDEVVGALLRSKEDWAEFQAGFSELATNMREAHLELLQDNEQRLEAVRRFWAEWQAELQAGLQDISTGVHGIQSDVDQARDSIRSNYQHLSEAFQQTSERVTDLTVQLGEGMHAVSEETVALGQLTQYVSELIQQGIVMGIYNATQSLEIANQMAIGVTGTLVDVTHRLGKLEEAADSVDKLNAGLNVLNGGWMGALGLLQSVAGFAGYAVIFSLLGVGIWQRVMSFPGNVCAALASGLALAYVCAVYYSPLEALHYACGILPSTMGMTGLAAFPVLYMSMVAAAIFFTCCIHRLLAGHWLRRLGRQQILNDLETDMPGRRFRLPVNDPKRVAEMTERRAMREADELKTWEV
ncbi:hypothetical protein LTR36_009949 [Oleoguttula mirabilis]|uniref:Uncharacterized protein n=1 Tax=Oleoguttula mirabilis TaxID=1507867 RepID=A0AAV9J4X8_9PEZI|nr:hypothetical protein LTR36_009949 [Oleoguttula mirabilis]